MTILYLLSALYFAALAEDLLFQKGFCIRHLVKFLNHHKSNDGSWNFFTKTVATLIILGVWVGMAVGSSVDLYVKQRDFSAFLFMFAINFFCLIWVVVPGFQLIYDWERKVLKKDWFYELPFLVIASGWISFLYYLGFTFIKKG